MIPEKETLEKYLEILQCIMRIQDWDIELHVVNDNECKGVYGDEAYGCNEVNRAIRASRIYINEDKCTDNPDSTGWYHTLVHELFHLVHDDLDDWSIEHLDEKHENAYKVEMERNINRFTRIFVSVYPLESLEEGIEDDEGGNADEVTEEK